jgi:hypothetical protein
MANCKTKYDILINSSTKMEWSEYVDFNYRMWDWDDYYDDYRSYQSGHHDYDYLPDRVVIDYISKRGLVCHKISSSMGQRVDMNSIYSPQIMRQKKIDAILGLGTGPNDERSNTLGDFGKIQFNFVYLKYGQVAEILG